MKTCNKCNQPRELSQYGKDKRNKDGLQGICEVCRKKVKQLSRQKGMTTGPSKLITEKTCNKCNKTKPVSEFYKDSGIADGHRTDCKACRDVITYSWREEHRNQYNHNQRQQNAKNYLRNRLYRYDLTPEQYNTMLKEQNGKCKLCGCEPKGKRPLVVDHNHDTGEVRGLLCYGCNRKIAILEKSAEEIKQAMDYVKGKKKE